MQTTTAYALNTEALAWALRFEAGIALGLSEAVELLVSDEEFLTGPMLAFITVDGVGSGASAWVDWEAAAEAIETGQFELSAEVAAAWLMAAHLAAEVPIDVDDTLRAMDLHACSIARQALGERDFTEPDWSYWEYAFNTGTPGRGEYVSEGLWPLTGVIA